jgi:tetratricopeptide (TPR) repeat protein
VRDRQLTRPFGSRIAAQHGALWSIDRGYRLWWYIWPSSIALLVCGWIYAEKPAGAPTSSSAQWGKPVSSAPVGSAGGRPDLSIRPEKLREDAAACSNTGLDLTRRIEACSRMIESGLLDNRQSVAAYSQRGFSLATTQPERALADYDAVLKIQPDHPEALTIRGWIYLSRRHFDAALADLNRAIELLAPDRAARARIYRANTLFQLKNYAEAIADLDESQKINPEYPDLYMLRGQVEYSQQRYDAALRDFEEFVRRAPRDPYGFLGRGMVLEATGHPREALLAFDDVLKIDPANAWTRAARDRLRSAGDHSDRPVARDEAAHAGGGAHSESPFCSQNGWMQVLASVAPCRKRQ